MRRRLWWIALVVVALPGGWFWFSYHAEPPPEAPAHPTRPYRLPEPIGQDPSPLKGRAFSDPAELAPKSADWIRQPLVYAPEAASADLVVSLDQQIYALFAEEIRRFAAGRGIRIALQEGTCGISAEGLEGKRIDVGGFCCPPGTLDRLPGVRFHTIGIAALALLVHPDNPVRDVTRREARAIFAGRLTRWDQLADGAGASRAPILVAARLHCKARPGHWKLIVRESAFTPFGKPIGDIPYMIDQVSRTPTLIGYETLHMVNRYAQAPVRVLTVDGVHPADHALLAQGAYPFYRVFSLTTWAPPLARQHATDLVAHLLAAVERDPDRYGLVPPSALRARGWRFQGGELVGEPENVHAP